MGPLNDSRRQDHASVRGQRGAATSCHQIQSRQVNLGRVIWRSIHSTTHDLAKLPSRRRDLRRAAPFPARSEPPLSPMRPPRPCSTGTRSHPPTCDGGRLPVYAMYQNIELHLPQLSIDSSMSKLFGLRLPRGWTNKMKMAAAQLYAITHDRLKLSEKPGTSGFDLYAKLEMEQAIAKTLRSNDNPFGFDSCVIHWRI